MRRYDRIDRRMTRTLAHRGPDLLIVWRNPGARIALGFRHLAGADLSTEGRQPRLSPGESFLRPEPIQMKWEEYLTGRSSREFFLWNVFMVQAWFEHWRNHNVRATVAALPQSAAA